MAASTPRVAVGMPVFNLDATVARAIESVLAQTFGDFELLVSDNASTDGSEAICRHYATRDSRIRFTRQPRPLGALDNFRFVLDTARAPYFMWLPADDYVLPRLLEQAVAVLQARPDVVCAAPRAEFLAADGTRRPAAGTFPLLGDVHQNLCRYLADPSDNSRFYGLYRREVVQRVLPREAYYGFDWVMAAGTLLHGKHVELPEVLLVREANEPLKYTRSLDTLVASRVARLLPLGRFTRALLLGLRVPPRPRLLVALLRLNVVHHVLYCQYRYPRYGRLVARVGAVLERLGAGAWRAVRRGPAT
jgi:glycosyltransferase involved in cell wall biosynthesis